MKRIQKKKTWGVGSFQPEVSLGLQIDAWVYNRGEGEDLLGGVSNKPQFTEFGTLFYSWRATARKCFIS